MRLRAGGEAQNVPVDKVVMKEIVVLRLNGQIPRSGDKGGDQ